MHSVKNKIGKRGQSARHAYCQSLKDLHTSGLLHESNSELCTIKLSLHNSEMLKESSSNVCSFKSSLTVADYIRGPRFRPRRGRKTNPRDYRCSDDSLSGDEIERSRKLFRTKKRLRSLGNRVRLPGSRRYMARPSISYTSVGHTRSNSDIEVNQSHHL